jgi:hypothetical protein
MSSSVEVPTFVVVAGTPREQVVGCAWEVGRHREVERLEKGWLAQGSGREQAQRMGPS